MEFEKYLISESENDEQVLYEKLQEIKTSASRIFAEINQNPTLKDNKAIILILKKYNSRFWSKILRFVELFYKINIPDINYKLYPSKSISKNKEVDYSNEYDAIILQNLNLAKEFIQLLHDFRGNKVNPSNLELDQLYDPQKLYNYLRNHHWKEGISKELLSNWIKMQKTGLKLREDDLNDFVIILKKLKVDSEFIGKLIGKGVNNQQDNLRLEIARNIPSVQNFNQFKEFLINRMDVIEKLIKKRI